MVRRGHPDYAPPVPGLPDADDGAQPGRTRPQGTPRRVGSPQRSAARPTPEHPAFCLGHLPRLVLMPRSAHVAPLIDDDRMLRRGLSGNELVLSTTQVLHVQRFFDTQRVVTQQCTSVKVVKPASDPGLPLLDRNEQPMSRNSLTGPSRGSVDAQRSTLEAVTIGRAQSRPRDGYREPTEPVCHIAGGARIPPCGAPCSFLEVGHPRSEHQTSRTPSPVPGHVYLRFEPAFGPQGRNVRFRRSTP